MIEAIIRAAILLLEVIFRLKSEQKEKDLVKEGLRNENPTLISYGLKFLLARVRESIRYYPERLRANLHSQLEGRSQREP